MNSAPARRNLSFPLLKISEIMNPRCPSNSATKDQVILIEYEYVWCWDSPDVYAQLPVVGMTASIHDAL